MAAVDYADGFATLLRCFDGRERERAFVSALLDRRPRTARAVDWGAGSGDLTRLLLERFDEVHAVEPDATMRSRLADACPRATIHPGTLQSVVLPAPVDVALASHVLYHVPDADWGDALLHMAGQLAPGGVLAVSLKAPDAGCNAMLAHFGAPRFDLRATLAPTVAAHPEFVFEFHRVPAAIATRSFEDTLRIARFVLADRPPAAFPEPPSDAAVEAYVRDRFWNAATGRGGWPCDTLFCVATG